MSGLLPTAPVEAYTETWNQVLAQLAQSLPPTCFDTWFRPLVLAGFDTSGLRLWVPNEHFQRGFRDHYAALLQDAVGRTTGTPLSIEVSVAPLPETHSLPLAASAAPGQQTLPVRQAADLQEADHRQSWLIEGLWTSQAVGILGGQPKCGKTWLALDMAVSVASGSPCLGTFPVHTPGSVLLYAAEDSTPALRARLESLALQRHLLFSHLDVRVITADSLRLDLPLDQTRMEATIRCHQPVLLILDPLVRVHRADENVSGQMAALLGYFRHLQRQTGVAIALVHHSRKNVSPSAAAGYCLRGSSDLYAWLDSFLYLRKCRHQITLSAEHRAAPALDPLTLELAGNSSPGAATYLRPASSTTPVNGPTLGEHPNPSVDPLPPRLLQLLSHSTDPLTLDLLRSKLQVRNQRVVEALRLLSAQGKVERVPRGYSIKT